MASSIFTARLPALLLLGLLAPLAPIAQGCIYQYGARHEVPHFTYGYIGKDWVEEYDTCVGTRQSPIQIAADTAFERVPDAEGSRFNYGKLVSTGNNIRVVNNGHTVQVALPADYRPNVTVVAKGDPATAKLVTKFGSGATDVATRVQVRPAQFHFHHSSEHIVDGKSYPLEMHIVNWAYNDSGLPGCGAGGCATVVGILFEMADEGDAATGSTRFIDTVFKTMASNENESSYLPTGSELNFDDVLPADRSYATYEGSLTTPPCTEGILWHVLVSPVKVTREQLHQFQIAVGETECGGSSTTVAERGTRLESGSSTPTASNAATTTTTTTTAFHVPSFVPDAVDGLQCRKLANGQNYREVQERGSRPVRFFAAPGVCDSELKMLSQRSSVLGRLLYPANNTAGMSLSQYGAIARAGLTTAANCSGVTSAAGAPAAGGAARALGAAAAGALLAAMLAV